MVPPTPAPHLIYKIATADAHAAAQAAGVFTGMPIDLADGYIHFSSAEQLAETLALHFRGQSGLMLLAVRTDAVADRLKWEPSRGGALFPHLYGPLPMTAVAWTAPVSVAADGAVDLPEAVR
jgi:uncharacterized protein (DUF952 family)